MLKPHSYHVFLLCLTLGPIIRCRRFNAFSCFTLFLYVQHRVKWRITWPNFDLASRALVLTPNPTTARQASGLLLGMHSVVVDSLADCEELIEEITYELIESGTFQVGDKMVVIAGRMASLKEQLQIVTLTHGQSHGRFVRSTSFFFNREMLLNYNVPSTRTLIK